MYKWCLFTVLVFLNRGKVESMQETPIACTSERKGRKEKVK